MNKYIRIASVAAAVAALACACSREIVPEAEPEFVDMPFVFSAEDAQGDLTRAAASLFPEVENWIFDIYYCQYAADGPSLMSGHIRKNVAVTDGTLTATEQITLRTASRAISLAANSPRSRQCSRPSPCPPILRSLRSPSRTSSRPPKPACSRPSPWQLPAQSPR